MLTGLELRPVPRLGRYCLLFGVDLQALML